MEHHMDVDMFLDLYTGWEVGSSHHPIILHEMFQYAVEQGQKEPEQMICQGCQHGLPKLDPNVDVSNVWLVGPQTSRGSLGPCIMKYTSLGHYQGPHHGSWNGWRNWLLK